MKLSWFLVLCNWFEMWLHFDMLFCMWIKIWTWYIGNTINQIIVGYSIIIGCVWKNNIVVELNTHELFFCKQDLCWIVMQMKKWIFVSNVQTTTIMRCITRCMLLSNVTIKWAKEGIEWWKKNSKLKKYLCCTI